MQARAMSWVFVRVRALDIWIELVELLESESCHDAMAFETSLERLSLWGRDGSRAVTSGGEKRVD